MKYTGRVKGGVVVLPPEAHLEEGSEVEILPVPSFPEEFFLIRDSTKSLPVGGRLPDDLAINHDYYLHGLRKQQPRKGRWLSEGWAAAELSAGEASDYTDKLLRLAAETRNLPVDLSTHHEHYLHGLPKR